MSSKRWLVVSLAAVVVGVACAEAEEQNPGEPDGEEGGSASGGSANGASVGKLATAGSSVVAQGGMAGSTSVGGSAGKGGSGLGGASSAGSGGKTTGGAAGTSAGGKSSAGGTGGTSTAGTSAAGTTSTGLSCTVEAAAGAATGAGGADVGAGGAFAVNEDAFFDDFESGVSNWTTTLGTWALVDDGSKAFAQSVQENQLQVAVVNGVCLADQVIDAKIKVVAFKGQSNSYVAALFGRVVSPSTHYLLALGSDGKLALRKRVNSTSTGATAIGSAAALSVTPGTWYDVHLEIIGTTLKGCVGAVCVTGTDASIASGSVGVGTVNTSARFDDVRVTAP
jgi:hypothetical protein